MGVLSELISLLAPPGCVTCGAEARSQAALCPSCGDALERLPVPPPVTIPGIDRGWAARPHEGVARELVAALKFRRLLAAAEPMAALIARRAPPPLLGGRAIVPVPAAPARSRRRGFDPAEELANQLAARGKVPVRAALRRANARPQVGRSRADRLADPPRIWAAGRVPRDVLLVDDVQTTGATLRACAEALRSAGAERVAAATFTRTLYSIALEDRLHIEHPWFADPAITVLHPPGMPPDVKWELASLCQVRVVEMLTKSRSRTAAPGPRHSSA